MIRRMRDRRNTLATLLRADLALLRQGPKFAVAVIGSLFIPALYALIYLSSLWDPASRSHALPAGIVNSDQGMVYRGQEVALGTEVLTALRSHGDFAWRVYADVESARRAVRRGELDFAVLLPENFSRLAVPGAQAGGAKLVIYTSEGNNYAGAGLARRFAPELAHRVNESLNARRWQLVLDSAAGSKLSLTSLRDGIESLRAGSSELVQGSQRASTGAADLERGLAQAASGSGQLHRSGTQLAEGSSALAGGARQLGSGLRQLDARRPSEADIQPLRSGAQTLVSAHQELGSGLNQLHNGALALQDGTVLLKAGAERIPLVGGDVALGAGQLEAGSTALAEGLNQARDAQARLQTGSQRLQQGVATLADGFLQYGAGVHQLAVNLPDDSRLDALASGSAQLAQGQASLDDALKRLGDGNSQLKGGLLRLQDGTERLHAGLDVLARALPADLPVLEGSAAGLADSVAAVMEVAAPVANNGSGFAPNFVPLALWVGAVMTAFLFHLRHVPEAVPGDSTQRSRLALALGKLALPAAVVVGQSLVMLAMLLGVLGVQVAHTAQLAATACATSLAFLLILFTLVRWLGDLGKVLGVLLLIVQISAADAAMPIQLAEPLFQTLHPWLPFTWVVKTFRASLFGAYDGLWLQYWSVIVACAATALLLATCFGRWKPVPADAYHPGIEID